MSEFERECSAYCDHLNELLQDYAEELKDYLPLGPHNLFLRLRDGVVLSYVLYHFYPECIRVDQLVLGIDLDGDATAGNQHAIFEATANLNRVVEAAKTIKGLVVVNFGSEDVLEMREDLVLGLLWQLIRSHLLGRVNLASHPELVRLLQPGESLAGLAALRPEPLLLRWFNFHLERSGCHLRVSGFSRDTLNGEAYLRLISGISPIDLGSLEEALQLPTEERLQLAIEWGHKLGCNTKVKASDLASGHPRLNLAFVAGLFNCQVGIHLPSEEEIREMHRELAGLRDRLASLDQELEATKPKEVELEKLRRASVDLGQQLEALSNTHQYELARIEAEFEGYKEELAAQYQESLESALGSERRLHQHELGQLKATLKEVRRRVLTQISDMHVAIGAASLVDTKVGLMLAQLDEEGPIEQLVQLQSHLAHVLAEKSAKQAQRIAELEGQLERKEKIEQVMAAKVREYSEQLIQHEQEQKEKREPALSSFRSKTLPAIRRAFTCTGAGHE